MHCFIVTTTYQLMTALHIQHLNKFEAELFILRNFIDAADMINKLKDTDLFKSVLPAVEARNSKYRNRYTDIWFGTESDYQISLINSNILAKLHLIDAGTFSYLSSSTLNKTLPRRVEDIYLFEPSMCGNQMALSKIKLQKIGEDNLFCDIINTLFERKNKINYADVNVIYLTHKNEFNISQYTDITEKILKRVDDDSKVIKLNPLDSADEYSRLVENYNYKIDSSSEAWEIIAKNKLNSDKVLMGVFNTSLFTPKLMFDIEPNIVFTYREYSKYLNINLLQEFDRLATRLKCLYRDGMVEWW